MRSNKIGSIGSDFFLCEEHQVRYRKVCDYCNREGMWKESFEEQSLKQTFPPRIRRDIERFYPPDKFCETTDRLKELLTPFQEPGNSLLLIGPSQSGKTLYAAALTMAYMKQQFILHGYDDIARFKTAVNMLDEIKRSFNPTSTIQNPTSSIASDMISEYCKVDWLVLDDIGVEKVTDWSYETLYRIINERYDNLKTTIFTSNLTVDSLNEQVGDRIASRIEAMSRDRIIAFDYRRKE